MVQIRDHNQMHNNLRVLLEGDHFGEIGMLYGCPRSCSVVSKNYTKMARMIRQRFIYVSMEEPNIAMALMNHISKYRDPYKNFIGRTLRHIPLFNRIRETNTMIFNEIIYTLCKKSF